MPTLKQTYADRLKSQIAAVSPTYVSPQEPDRHDVDLTRGEVRWDWPNLLLDRHARLRRQDFWYQDPRGDEALRAAYLRCVAALDDNHNPLTIGNVLICAGGKQAMFLAMHSLIQPGDRVLLPRPGWSPYAIWAGSLGAETLFYDACDPEAADLIARLRGSSCQHLVVNSPNNPSGVELTWGSFKEIAQEASQAGISILSDEVYRRFSESGASFIPFVGQGSAPVLVVDSASKWLAAAGLRIGFLLAEADLIDAALTIRSAIDSCPSGPSQVLAASMLSEFAADERAAIQTFVRSRLRNFLELLAAADVEIAHSGGLYVWLHAVEPVLSLRALKGPELRGIAGAVFGQAGYARFCPTAIADDAALAMGLRPCRPLEAT